MTEKHQVLRVDSPAEDIRVFTIDRAESRNAINDAVARQLETALRNFDSDPTARVGILTGAGSGFCAGLDLKAFLDGELGETSDGGFAGFAKSPPTKPLIAAVEGFALAGGFELLLACDLVVASSDARLGLPEVRRGLAADGGALLRMPRRIPVNVAMELALTGAEVSTVRLASLGLINVVTEPGRALTEAISLATDIASNSPLGVVASKQVLRASPAWTDTERWARQAEIVKPIWTSNDAKEGARAFQEKRPPRFAGN